MSINVILQVLRKGTKYESYRLSIPKSIIESHDWKNKKFKLDVIDGKIVLTPL